MTAACLALARRFRRDGRSGWAVYTLASGIATFLFFGAASGGPNGVPFLPEVYGLLQRLSIVAALSWLAVLAISLLISDRSRA